MNIEELEKWLLTNEGQQWIETQKQGLANKNTELLEKLKSANGELEKANGEVQKLKGDLEKEQGSLREALLSRPLAQKLKDRGVFEVLLPELSKSITEVYDLHVLDGNAAGKIKHGDKETSANLEEIVDHWSKLDASKDNFRPRELTTVSTVPILAGGVKPQTDLEWDAMRKGAGLSEED